MLSMSQMRKVHVTTRCSQTLDTVNVHLRRPLVELPSRMCFGNVIENRITKLQRLIAPNKKIKVTSVNSLDASFLSALF